MDRIRRICKIPFLEVSTRTPSEVVAASDFPQNGSLSSISLDKVEEKITQLRMWDLGLRSPDAWAYVLDQVVTNDIVYRNTCINGFGDIHRWIGLYIATKGKLFSPLNP